MRLNAPRPALLALAVLLFSPACVLAKPTHHLVRATPVPLAPVHGAAASSKRGAHRKAAGSRVREDREGRGSRHYAPAVRRVREQSSRGRKHLLHASARNSGGGRAGREWTASEPSRIPAAVAIHGTLRPDEPRAVRSSARSRRNRLHKSDGPVSRQVTVVSVIRPTTRRPQLPSIEEAAATPVILPTLYNKRGRLILPPPLKGSHEILIRQNEVADHDGLQRIQNDDDLEGMRGHGLLVALPLNGGMEVDERLPVNRRFCRPWTARFLANLSRAHYAQFHTPLQVNSAVRTVEFQQHLMHINGNAAPAEGDTASPHLTGQAVDLAKHGLSLSEIAWMRGYLLPLVQEGKIDVEEEFKQSCFHISVYKRYVPSANMPERDLASSHREGMPALAAVMQ